MILGSLTKRITCTSIKHKSEVFGLFKVFKDLVENQSGRKLKVLRFDNGGEYVKYEFI